MNSVLRVVVAGLLCAGCEPVRENRSITFSRDGSAVGFQHGRDGVYVAGKEGAGPMKVFEPGPEVAAVSTPLWNPKDGRLLFTTARPKHGRLSGNPRNQEPNPKTVAEVDSDSSVRGTSRPDNPAGVVYGQQPITYTCWLRDETKGEKPPEPVALFDAECDHIGYVAANFAVRWHPAGDRILYIHKAESGGHELLQYELATKMSHRIFPYTAPALIFDWTPHGSRLACVLGGTNKGRQDGIWIGNPDEGDWWHVQESQNLAQGELPSLLERLRATQPVWTKDDTRFAFVSTQPPPHPSPSPSGGEGGVRGPDHHVLWLGEPSEHRVTVAAEGAEPFSDLHWRPEGTVLGLVLGRTPGSLCMVREDGKLSKPVNRLPVRRFAGWNANGDHLAYTVPDNLPYRSEEHWAFLLLPAPLGRDAVYVARGSGDDPGREVFSGMRVTFPSWSTKDDKLSLWFTFSPAYRFLLYMFFGGGLYPGDPAAVLDVRTGSIDWMAVNDFEKAQVGHYHLLKRDYAAAWARYQEVDQKPPTKRLSEEEFLRNLLAPRDFTLFEYLCLKKLGRKDQAASKLAQFHRTFMPEPSQERKHEAEANLLLPWLNTGDEIWPALLKDFYAAEIFLSLDAAEDAQQFFEESLRTASTDAERLSCSIALGQVLLLEKKHVEYAELTTSTVAPLLLKLWKPPDLPGQGSINDPRWLFVHLAGLALMPLYSPQFLGDLSKESLQGLVARWTALGEKAPGDLPRLGADLFLHAAYQTLGRQDKRQEVARRIGQNPAAAGLLPKEGYEDLTKSIRKALAN